MPMTPVGKHVEKDDARFWREIFLTTACKKHRTTDNGHQAKQRSSGTGVPPVGRATSARCRCHSHLWYTEAVNPTIFDGAMLKKILSIALLGSLISGAMAQTGTRNNKTNSLPSGYWPLEKSQPIIDKTQTIRLAPEVSQLTEGERKAVAKLLEAGQIFQHLYEAQRHKEAASSFQALLMLDKRMGSAPA